MNAGQKAVDVLGAMARRQHGPEVDPDTGADRGSCCEHAWADGWNDCIGNLAEARAAMEELIRQMDRLAVRLECGGRPSHCNYISKLDAATVIRAALARCGK